MKLLSLGLIASLTTPLAPTIAIEQQVQAVASHLVGVMDTTAQTAANPDAPSVRMTTCRVAIAPENTDSNSIYLYQEQALTTKLSQPYRQRLLEIKPSQDRATVESQSFKLQTPENSAGLCDKPEKDRVLLISDLGEAVCSVFLKPTDRGYLGETPPQGCPAPNVRGAVKITNTILLHSEGMDTWDRGFDERGNQVWGAENDSYQYRWVDRK